MQSLSPPHPELETKQLPWPLRLHPCLRQSLPLATGMPELGHSGVLVSILGMHFGRALTTETVSPWM